MDRSVSQELMSKMRLGWNLGNTLDAPMGETSWHNPVTTREMVLKIHALGFETLRLPTSWHRHMDEEHTVTPEWLDRVNEILDYAYNDGMYVILNTHHDDWMFQPTAEGFENGKRYLSTLWAQLSKRFEAYGERLIFEAMNEPRMVRHKYEWNLNLHDQFCLDAIEYINRYNQIFVDTVRSQGGNNKLRFLMTPSYAAAPHHAFIPAFRVAQDPADRIIVSVHSYAPIELCLMPNPDVREFTEEGERILDHFMGRLHKCFIENGIPVVIGEMGMWDKDNPEERYKWSKYFVSKARELGMVCCWWDNGGREFKLFDRRNCEVYEHCLPVLKGLTEGAG